jgi:hypothetical protein
MREGSSSYIFIDPGGQIATKQRKQGHYSSLMAEYYMHRYVYMLLCSKKYACLFAPQPFICREKEYSMEAIENSYLIMKDDYDDKLKRELKEFYIDMASHGFFPHDFELYMQIDGRVAMIDFDKFGEWMTCEEVAIDSFNVTFEPAFLLCSPLLPSEAPSWIEDIKQAVKIYNRDSGETSE